MGWLASIAPKISVLLFFVISISIHSAVVLYALIDFLSMGSADNITHMASHGHIVVLLVGLAFCRARGKRSRYFRRP